MNNRFRVFVESLVYCLCFSIVWIAVAPLSESLAATTNVDSVSVAPLNDDMIFTKTIALDDVTRVNLAMNAALDIRFGDTESVTAIGSKEDLAALDVHVNNEWLELKKLKRWLRGELKPLNIRFEVTLTQLDKLRLRGQSIVNIAPVIQDDFRLVADGRHIITVSHVDVKTIGIEMNGSSTLRADRVQAKNIDIENSGSVALDIGHLQASKLNFEMSGSTVLQVLSGEADDVSLEMSGACQLHAKDMKVKTADLEMNGASKASMYVTETLAVEVNGAGKVTYGGSPLLVKSEINGAGMVKQQSSRMN